ncbi:sortilin (neurotensin receptor 3) [Maribacter vaceletii]|uniref:Sortilin (Neurotensin receptor 3) n=1 Tax=Maribacter vaceletii TaxID=1206816 RepID=A0A495E8L7_9FLAO|nr:hypothetical protein [Maribacter vaceletii]RKR13270.1 sortilin (neurotensin receptor 3) [Maribacter vaceletii]
MKTIKTVIVAFLMGIHFVGAQDTFFDALKKVDVVSDSSIVWRQFGPGMSGNNKSAFWHPTDVNTLFISPNMGNSYVTNDAGLTYQTVLDEDGRGIRYGERGPNEFGSIDFSRQSSEFGFATDLKTKGIFVTANKGKIWKKHEGALSTFGKAYLSCVTVNPKDDNIWYVGAGRMRYLGKILFSKEKPHGTYTDAKSQGKVWKSINRGRTWKLINRGLHANAEVETIVVDPVQTNVVYMSTNYGFYKSINGGKNWKLKNEGLDTDVIRSFSMHHDKKTNKKTLFLIASVLWDAKGKTITDKAGGVFKSTDEGESWQKINGDLAMDMSHFKNDRTVRRSYYHTLGYYFGVTDKKAAELYPEFPKKITQRFTQISVDPNDVNNIYLINMYTNASRNNFMPGAMWRSKDGGKHWYVTFRNGKRWNKGKDVAYWQKRENPTGSNVRLLYLNDWMNRDDYDRKSVNYAKFNANGSVLHTQMAKISLMSYDKGDTWVDIDDVETSAHSESYIGAGNSNMPGHGFYQDTRFPGKVYCMAGENTLWVTNEETNSKRPGAQAATFHNLINTEASLSAYAIHPKDSKIHYSMYFRQHERGNLMRSIDGGKTWLKHGTAIPKWEIKAHSGDQPVHQINLIFDYNNPDTMYFCVPKSSHTIEYVGNSETGFGVHKSTDGGKTWKEINNGLPASCDVSAIRIDPKKANVLYATVQNKNGGLYKTIDMGEHWSKVKSTIDISGKYGVNDIQFAKDGKVYISAGFKNEEADKGGLWVSDKKMKSWKQIFQYPWVNRVEVAKYDADIILVSTLPNANVEGRNAGTYLSKNGGKSWIKINKGNGQSDRINDIAIDYTTPGKYYVSTYGSGFYVAKE